MSEYAAYYAEVFLKGFPTALGLAMVLPYEFSAHPLGLLLIGFVGCAMVPRFWRGV